MNNELRKDISIPNLIAAIISWVLTIAWMILIFYLSSENGAESTNRSTEILKFVELVFGKDFVSDMILRKIAHVIEFSVLTVLAFCSARFTNKISHTRSYAESPVKLVKSDNEMYIAITLWLTMLTAVLDEYHQLFVEGRNGSIRDVLIDAIGIIIILIIIRIIFTIYLKYLGRNEIRYE